jgi:hypothetical protein
MAEERVRDATSFNWRANLIAQLESGSDCGEMKKQANQR